MKKEERARWRKKNESEHIGEKRVMNTHTPNV